jgi:predicted nucleotidyltransferase
VIKGNTVKISEIKRAIVPALKKYNIPRAGIFGSVAIGEEGAHSDIDILVELGSDISLLTFISIKYELEEILGKKVDLVEYRSLKPRIRDGVLAEEVRMYG